MYKDGNQICQGMGSGSLNADSPGDLVIGNAAAGGFGFDGLIDEVRVYSRALSRAEVMAVYGDPGLAVNVPPAILSFSASPSSIVSGTTSTLDWNVSGAALLSIDSGIGIVAGILSL